MPSTISPSSTNGAEEIKISRNNGEEPNITIDNDDFNDAHDFLIEKRDIGNLAIQIQNIGNTNGLSFEIYGSINPTSPAPAFALKEWELLTNGSGDITLLNNKLFESKYFHIWILIRLKRQTTSLDTTAQILTTSGNI